MKKPQSYALTLSVREEKLAVCSIGPESEIPAWAVDGPFFSLTRTEDELSIICPEACVPSDVACEKGWRALKLEGPFDFDMTGVLVSVTAPLAEAGVSVLAIATYETDYVLVREDQLGAALSVLARVGHTVQESSNQRF